MKPTTRVAETTAPDGAQFVLLKHDGEFLLYMDDRQIMTTTLTHSELLLADIGCTFGKPRKQLRVLIGGLGLGFRFRYKPTNQTPHSEATHMAPWPILQRACVPIAHAPSTCCMCANDIPQEDLIDCNTCYRCLKKFCQTCSPFLKPQIPVSSMYWYNDEYDIRGIGDLHLL